MGTLRTRFHAKNNFPHIIRLISIANLPEASGGFLCLTEAAERPSSGDLQIPLKRVWKF